MKHLIGLMLSLTAGGLYAAQPSESTRQVYISPAGDDPAGGTQDAPFRTLLRAQEAARVLCKDMQGDIIVHLAPGEYRLDHPVQLTDEDSGRNGFRVIYRSDAGPGKARLIGSVLIKGWQPWRDGIWKVALPAGVSFHTLYENGARVHKARFPHWELDPQKPTALGKYLVTIDGTPKLKDKQLEKLEPPYWLEYRAEDAPPVTSVTKMKLQIYPGGKCDWVREIHAVISIDSQTHRIIFDHVPFHGVGVGARFFLEDELGFLGVPGEFFLDDKSHTLYYMPVGKGNPDDLNISYPVLSRVIQMQGKSRTQCVEHLVLESLAIEESDDSPPLALWATEGMRDGALVWMNNTNHVELHDCHLKNSGRSGVMMIGHNTDDLISGGWIEHAGLNGVSLCNHFLAEDKKSPTENRCENNHIFNTRISHVGELHTYAECVTAFNVSNNDVDHCQLDNSVRYALTLRGNTGEQYGPPISTAYPATGGNHFHHLKISRCGQDGGDMGAIHGAALNNPGGGCVNTFEQIIITDTAAIESMKDIPPNGIFLDWPKMAMDQVFRNIRIERTQGKPFRAHGPDNESSAVMENVSWKPGFQNELMDEANIGLTSEFPRTFLSPNPTP